MNDGGGRVTRIESFTTSSTRLLKNADMRMHVL
jgi:hypothetical protein